MFKVFLDVRLVFLNLVFVSILCNGLERKQNRILFYDSPSVELQGRLSVKTFPGPPNYESIKGGDEAESGYYLTLGKPIDVAPDFSKPSESILFSKRSFSYSAREAL